MNFKDQLFQSSPLFFTNNILQFSYKIALENILLICKSTNRQVPPLFCKFEKTYMDMKLADLSLTSLTF